MQWGKECFRKEFVDISSRKNKNRVGIRCITGHEYEIGVFRERELGARGLNFRSRTESEQFE